MSGNILSTLARGLVMSGAKIGADPGANRAWGFTNWTPLWLKGDSLRPERVGDLKTRNIYGIERIFLLKNTILFFILHTLMWIFFFLSLENCSRDLTCSGFPYFPFVFFLFPIPQMPWIFQTFQGFSSWIWINEKVKKKENIVNKNMQKNCKK